MVGGNKSKRRSEAELTRGWGYRDTGSESSVKWGVPAPLWYRKLRDKDWRRTIPDHPEGDTPLWRFFRTYTFNTGTCNLLSHEQKFGKSPKGNCRLPQPEPVLSACQPLHCSSSLFPLSLSAVRTVWCHRPDLHPVGAH